MSKENVQPSLIFRPVKQWYDADVIGYPAAYPCPECGAQERFTFTRATGRKTCDACGAFVDTMPAGEVMRRHAQAIIAGTESHESARMIEDWCAERPMLWALYLTALRKTTGWGEARFLNKRLTALLRATPEQRARAYLEAVAE